MDVDGHVPWPPVVAYGALFGAVVNTSLYLLTTNDPTLRGVGGAALGGAISGASGFAGFSTGFLGGMLGAWAESWAAGTCFNLPAALVGSTFNGLGAVIGGAWAARVPPPARAATTPQVVGNTLGAREAAAEAAYIKAQQVGRSVSAGVGTSIWAGLMNASNAPKPRPTPPNEYYYY